jgi:murein DD-endopeptidase MepM/ murein hydrolase activator NlpD
MGIGAQVTISGFHGFGNVDAPVFDDMMYKSNDSDAVWWEPQSARSFLILGNSSQDPVHAQIDFANRFRVDLDLAAHSTVIRSIPHLRADHNGHDGDRDHEGTINSLHVAGTGMPGTLRVTGYTVSDEGFLNTIRGYDPSSSTEAAVYANGLHFSASDNHLLVKNLTINPITVSGTIYPIAASKSVSPLTISEKQITGGAAVELALPKSENAESFDGSSVKLTSSGPAGSIVASYSSHNSNNRITRAVPFKDIGDPGISTGGYPWRIDGHYDSKIYITNVGKIRAAFGGAIRPKGGPEYFIDTHYLEVGETAVLDIRRLRDEQIADPHGIKLSNDATAGQFDWTTIHGDGSQRLIGRNEVTDGSSGVSASFSCGGVCNCPYSITYAFLTPGEPVVFENGASSLTATAQSTPTCSGGYPSNFTIYPYAWSINNPGYFTVSPVNQPTSNFQGTVTPGASWFYTPYTGVQYAWNGQSGQCVTNGNPVLNPGGNGFTQTPSQHTYPNAPLAGCRVRVPFDGVINKTTGKKHQAQDTVSSSIQVGTPVYAPEAGTITNFATGNPHDTRDPSVCGGTGVPANFIELQQDSDGALTRLYHVTILANLATKGTHVNGGVQIGTIDISGCTSAPHTHIQRKVGGVLVNFTMPCDNSHFDDPGTYYDDSEAW